jgi:hypothetical protein
VVKVTAVDVAEAILLPRLTQPVDSLYRCTATAACAGDVCTVTVNDEPAGAEAGMLAVTLFCTAALACEVHVAESPAASSATTAIRATRVCAVVERARARGVAVTRIPSPVRRLPVRSAAVCAVIVEGDSPDARRLPPGEAIRP